MVYRHMTILLALVCLKTIIIYNIVIFLSKKKLAMLTLINLHNTAENRKKITSSDEICRKMQLLPMYAENCYFNRGL